MRFFFFIFLNFLLVNVFSQKQNKDNKTFVLQGNVKGNDTGYIILSYVNWLNKYTRDTAHLQKGKFKFEGKVNEPTYVSLSGKPRYIDFNDVNYENIFIQPGKQYISLEENNYENAKVNGLATQKELDTLLNKFNAIKAKSKPLDDEVLAAKKEAVDNPNDSIKNARFNRLSDKLQSKYDAIKNAAILFIAQHPDSYVSSYFFGIYIGSLSVDSLQLLYNRFTAKIKNSRTGKWDKAELIIKKNNLPGATAPDIIAKDISGKEVRLSGLRNNYVLLDFWASWCVPCIQSIPHLKEIYSQYESQGLKIITISIDKNATSWKNEVQKQQLTGWYNILADDDIRKNYRNATGAIPSQILIDSHGKIIWNSDDINNKEDLDMVLKKQ